VTETQRNPFRPGVGTRPPVLAGRETEMLQFRRVLNAAPEIPANVRLIGLRGVGKTVLLSEFATIAENQGWASGLLELEPRHNEEDGLSNAIDDLAGRQQLRLSRLAAVRERIGGAVDAALNRVKIEYNEVSLSFASGSGLYEVNLSKALYDVVEAAQDAGRAGFALMLDEAQVLRDDRAREGEHPLSLLLAAVSALQRASLPIALVVCGLPTLTGNLLKARTYTERMFRGMEIGSLDGTEARRAFVDPLPAAAITAEAVLVTRVLEEVEGYPYFIQLWGAELWDAAKDAGLQQMTIDLLEAVEPGIYRRLDSDFYEPRIQTLTPAEQDLLLGAGRCPYPPLRVAELQQFTNKRPGNVNVLLGRLVDAGVLYRLRKGEYEYTAPKFSEYLLRRLKGAGPHEIPPFEQTTWTETNPGGDFRAAPSR
jgi:hypothetical protein